VRDGDPEAPFDLSRQHAREQQIFGEATPFYGWHYPPFFLFVAAALALMPYGVALAVWQAVTFGLYLLTIWAIIGSSFRGAQSANPESIATAPRDQRQAGSTIPRTEQAPRPIRSGSCSLSPFLPC
jgi:hypothetical protein